MSIDSYVVSKHLMLESEDGENGVVIHNTRTGHRLSLTEESVKVLEVFRSAKSTQEAARELGVAEGELYEEFLSIIVAFSEAFFLVSVTEGKAEEPLSVDKDTLFVSAQTPFVYCPSVDVENLEEGTIVVAGVSLDQATTGNPGTRLGPDRLREVSTKFLAYERDIFTRKSRGWHNADLGTVILEGVPFGDLGNVAYRTGEPLTAVYERCYRGALLSQQSGALPVFIGGDHSISAPLIRACAEVHREVVIIHLDAHTDMGEWEVGSEHHHGNVMRRMLYENPTVCLLQFGVRGFAGAPLGEVRCETTTQASIEEDMEHVLQTQVPKGKKCYISLDVDVIDPSFAPGTGTPVPLGMNPRTLLKLLRAVAENNQIVGMDVVELSPSLDRDDMTTSLVFHVLMKVLYWITLKK
ncbi:arginase family protein [Candidatus Kaiserbacteria bacterium]|nr:MAG: arginase family protein [Candidatus Kaiserbacteria bacterium]